MISSSVFYFIFLDFISVTYRLFKSFLDRCFSFLAIILLSPLFVLVGFLAFLFIGPPIFYTQLRPGLYGKPFRIYKYRTMSNLVDSSGVLLPDVRRQTYFGRILRYISFDELPALFNILQGQMSFVGPRPLLMEYLPLYSDQQSCRHDVKPGLSGWAQINGRNALSWDQKFRFDIWYVDNQSFWLDLRILVITIFKVLLCEGISADGEATMEPFTGSASDKAL